MVLAVALERFFCIGEGDEFSVVGDVFRVPVVIATSEHKAGGLSE